jgi:hypothetical protein
MLGSSSTRRLVASKERVGSDHPRWKASCDKRRSRYGNHDQCSRYLFALYREYRLTNSPRGVPCANIIILGSAALGLPFNGHHVEVAKG